MHWISDEKWIHYNNLTREKLWIKPSQTKISTAKLNIHGSMVVLCIQWDQLGFIYYEVSEPYETITEDHRRLKSMC